MDAFDLRLQLDYEIDAVIDEEKVKSALERAQSFLAAARDFLGSSSGTASGPSTSRR